ncbi:GMC oxidoreductase [Armillaria mellea]|nr:GMC oxidoreductase [Armillaria mellea]
MGSSHSKVTSANLGSIATEVNASASSGDANNWKSYNYIIVGGGTAGCVLASRLSENPDVTVLLIEAGKLHKGDLLTSIPLAFSKIFKTDVDWNYETTCRAIYWPRGKILGGTSSINCLIYHRCARDDFDEWNRLGASGWSYKDLLPYVDLYIVWLWNIETTISYFLKAEAYTPDQRYPNVKASDHGASGPWKTAPQHCPPAAIHNVLLKTCEGMKLPYISDMSSETGTLGSTEFLSCIDQNGKRSSSATAYLTPAMLARPNLIVITRVMVEKVLFDTSASQKPRAIGVELSKTLDGSRFCVRASREVLLCAGAVGTPQILLLSGVGPRDDLQKLGISVIKDHPVVGRHLLDHPSCGTVLFCTKASQNLTWDYVGGPLTGAWVLIKWLLSGKGPMAGISFPGGIFVHSGDPSLPFYSDPQSAAPVKDNTSGPTAPDLKIVWMPLLVLENRTKRPPSGVMGVSMGAMVMRPSSEGYISLKTASVWDKPNINPNYLADDNDMNVLIRGVRLILKMAHSEPFHSSIEWGKPDPSMPWLYPGNTNPDKISDQQLKEWITENEMATWHPASSARMGRDVTSSVVDANLKVHGIESLRVIDASVFPNQVSGHPCAVVVAVAEKAADMIKTAHNEA